MRMTGAARISGARDAHGMLHRGMPRRCTRALAIAFIVTARRDAIALDPVHRRT
jgi:hypothetical protein